MTYSVDVPNEQQIRNEKTQELQDIVREPAEAARLRQIAEANVAAILSIDMNTPSVKSQHIKQMDEFGRESMQRSQNRNDLLRVTMGKLSQTGGESGEVAMGLMELNREMKELDPSRIMSVINKGVVGKLTRPIRNYFARFEKADKIIANIVSALNNGKKTLQNDNRTIEMEKNALWELTVKIKKEIEMASMMNEVLTERLHEAEMNFTVEPEKISFIRDEMLFPLTQTLKAMYEMLLINQQAVVTMEIIQRTNRFLISGVERAQNVTVTALRTAVTAAESLYNQKVVINMLGSLNETTGNIIAATSEMLRMNVRDTADLSTKTSIEIGKLKSAFENTMGALEDISTFRQKALPAMQANIAQFREIAERGDAAMRMIEKSNSETLY